MSAIHPAPGLIPRAPANVTRIHISEETKKRALEAAQWVTASPHEWQWSQEDQVAMARFCRWAAQRLIIAKLVIDGVDWDKEKAEDPTQATSSHQNQSTKP